MLSVLSSYVVSFWIKCLVCCLYTMNEYSRQYQDGIKIKKVCNKKPYILVG